jgi:hypothetical protein
LSIAASLVLCLVISKSPILRFGVIPPPLTCHGKKKILLQTPKYLYYNDMSNGYVVIVGIKAATTITSISVISMVTLLLVILLLYEMLPLTCLVAMKKRSNILVANFGNTSCQIIQKGYKQRILIALMGVSRGTSIINMEEESRTAASPYSSSSPSPAASKSKLVRSSFRIEEDVLRALVGAAEKKDISLSSLVNKTLKNYTTSEMYLEELGFILVSKTFLRKIFDRLDEKDIKELGKEYGLTIAKEYVSFLFAS